MRNQKPKRGRFLLYAPVCALAILFLLLAGLRYLGFWLVLDEPLEHSAAIVVMGGGFPYRPAKAADLFKEGWAKEIWLTQGSKNDRDRDLESYGIPVIYDHESGRGLLEKLGVPSADIRLVPQPVDNTMTELRAVRAQAEALGADRLIIVTSKQHTRRVRVIWNGLAGKSMGREVKIIVRSTPRETYDEEHWWRTTTDALSTFREAFGILNAWAGFPVAPREH